MIDAIQRRLRDREDGFTLIELMVVVMIIAILVTIAIPAFLGARKRAQDAAAKSNVRNGLSTAQTIYSDSQDYINVTVALLQADEPNLTFQAGASTSPKQISVATPAADTIVLAAKSVSGKCFYLRHVTTPGLATSGTQTVNPPPTAASCATDAVTVAGLTFTAV